MLMKILRIGSQTISLVLLIILAAGCQILGPDYVPPEMASADAWHQRVVSELTTTDAPLHSWWTLFKDDDLARLIDATRTGNLDLQTALARIAEADALYGASRGAQVPDAQLEGSISRSRLSEIIYPGMQKNPQNIGVLSGGLSWELDFWGRVRRQIESAAASYEASQEDYRDGLVILQAAVAQSYVQLRTLQQRLRYAQENAQLQEATLKLTQDRLQAEIAHELDVRQAEMNLAMTNTMIPALQTGIDRAMNQLCVFTGRAPGAWPELRTNFTAMPAFTAVLPATLPAEMIRQRCDIRAAERRLAAQTAKIGVAKGELYPMFSLAGNFGWQVTAGGQMLESPGRFYGLGPAFQWNIFSGGRIRSLIKAEEARQQQTLMAYEGTVLRALQECENMLSTFVNEQQQLQFEEQAVTAARFSAQKVDELYRAGLTDFQNVLDMQRTLTQRQDSLASCQGEVANALIAIYKAFGGGWKGGEKD
ncbi:MAG: efflux transporter outer membrane subunit [Lentisphaeria bacterium]